MFLVHVKLQAFKFSFYKNLFTLVPILED